MTGYTQSTDFPTTAGAVQAASGGGFDRDAFVTKLNPAGTALVYSTYLGGSGDDEAFGIAVDALGSAYVTGYTNSPNFPTPGAVQPVFGGGSDAFVTKLNPAGAGLVYSTYLGGRYFDVGRGIAVDALGSAYVTGWTLSDNFPTTAGTVQPAFGGFNDAFVTNLNPTGGFVYSTYLGGSHVDQGYGIAVDALGNAYVTGETVSTNFPTTGTVQPTFGGGFSDAFVTELTPTGTGLVYSTYLGGSSADVGFGVAVDALGSAYVTGGTDSPNFPTTAGAVQPTPGFGGDAFVTKLAPAGTALLYSTYLGGSSIDTGVGIAVDAQGSAYVTGATNSPDFPTAGPGESTFGGGVYDAFVTKLAPAGTELVYSTYLGGSDYDVGFGIAVDAQVNAYVTGATASANFPTVGAEQPTFGGVVDAFVAKIAEVPASTPGCEVTIGGKITAQNGDPATFDGNARASSSGQQVSGRQQYKDHGPARPLTVTSINVLAVVCSADRTEATIFGQATIDGAGPFDYRIHVKDLGTPGNGKDVYGIVLSNGYASGDQTLDGGNVQIR